MNDIVDKIELALVAVQKLQDAGFTAVFAGGAVRDMLCRVEPKDIDIATNATPDQVESLFEKTVAVGKSFGVVRVIIQDDEHLAEDEEFEVATFREDSEESDGRRPNSVKFSSMETDAKRRDFSVNGLFFNPVTDEIFDFVQGQADLKTRTIRFIGNPRARIEEDNLRVLRGIRFGSRAGWHLESKTEQAIRDNIYVIRSCSAERVEGELTKMFAHRDAHIAFQNLLDFGAFSVMLPNINALKNCKQDKIWHPEGCVFTHTKLMLKNAGESLAGNKVLAWSIVLHDIAKPQTFAEKEGRITAHGHAELGAEMSEQILNSLRFDCKTRDAIVWVVRNHMKFFAVKEMKQATRLKFIAEENFEIGLELHRLDCISSNGDLSTFEFWQHIKASTPKNQIVLDVIIDGNDLIALGLKPSKLFREILEKVKDEQREGRITTKEQAISFAKTLIPQS